MNDRRVGGPCRAMKGLDEVCRDLEAGRFEFSRHALIRAVERNISREEIREVGVNAELIEDYPDDKYSPSALLLGFTLVGRPIHIQVTFADTVHAKIVTLYEPDESEWINFRYRR